MTTVVGTRQWYSWHLHVASLDPGALESVVVRVVAPTVAEFGRHGDSPRPWFFIRYWQGGPHVRLRLSDLGDGPAGAVGEALRRRTEDVDAAQPGTTRLTPESYRLATAPIADRGESGAALPLDPLRPPGAHTTRYEPEARRYGGPGLIELSEDLFHASSVVSLRVCQARAGRTRRAADALEAMAATLSAWPGDPLALLRAVRDGWADWLGETADAAPVRGFEAAAPALRALAGGAPSRWSPWTDRLRAAAALWTDRLGEPRARQIFASHLHMTQNRLGVGAGREGRLAGVLLGLLGG